MQLLLWAQKGAGQAPPWGELDIAGALSRAAAPAGATPEDAAPGEWCGMLWDARSPDAPAMPRPVECPPAGFPETAPAANAENAPEATPANIEAPAPGAMPTGEGEAGHWASLPQELEARLPEVRRELLHFVYALGRLRVDGREVQEHLRAGDSLSMWWCSLIFEKHPRVTPGLYPALKVRALELWLEGRNIDTITLVGGDDALTRCLREFCAVTQRRFATAGVAAFGLPRPAHAPRDRLVQRLYRALPAPVRAMVRLAHWLVTVKRHLPATVERFPQGRYGTIATYFPNLDAKAAERGRFRSRYWESLHDALGQTPDLGVHWLLIRFPSPQFSFAACRELARTFTRGGTRGKPRDTFHYLEEFVSLRGLGCAVARHLRLTRAAWRLAPMVREQCCLPHSRMNLWPWLGEYWHESFAGWRGLERCIQRVGFRAYTRWAGTQRWTIFPMENCPWERMLTEAVHTAGHGVVYGTQHSTVRPTDFRYFDAPQAFVAEDCRLFQPDAIFGNGQGACQAMLEAGTPVGMVGQVEALRYMYLAAVLARRAEAASAAPMPTTVAGAASGRLLVVTSFFADEVDAHMRVLAHWMATPEAAAWEVSLKPHPYLAVEPFWKRHAAPEQPPPPVLQGAIGQYLRPGTVVWASNSTTVALESALLGLPTLAQLPEDDVDLCPVQGMAGVARVASVADVRRALAAPEVPCPPEGYLALDAGLPRWRRLLGLAATPDAVAE